MAMPGRGEDAASYLQEVSTPNLYINNAFRVTRLDVTATLKEAKKLIKDWEQLQRLGIPHKSPKRAYFPIRGTLSTEDIKIAVDQKILNPFRRVIEELFWFWPDPNKELADDEALSYLRSYKPDMARDFWIASANSCQANIFPLHNLAVLNHQQALEIEQDIGSGGCFNLLCPKCKEFFRITFDKCDSIINCPNCSARLRTPERPKDRPHYDEFLARLWREACQYWSRLWISSEFWAELSLRAKNIDENIGPEYIDQIKRGFPEAFLGINAQLSIEYCSKQNHRHAIRQAEIICSSKFSNKYQHAAIHRTTKAIIDRVHQQAKLAEKNATDKPNFALQEAAALVDKTSSDINCFGILGCSGLNLGYAACDAVAESALNSIIAYGNTTGDCRSAISLIREVLKIAKSTSVKDRVSRNLEIFVGNARQQEIDENIELLGNLCKSIRQAAQSVAQDDRFRPQELYEKFRDEVIPKLNNAKAQFGEESEEFKRASSICAFCLRGISVALHNISGNIALALDSIQWAESLCTDNELRNMLAEDLKICQQHADEERRLKRKENIEKYKPLIWVIGIALFAFIYDAIDKSSSSSTIYSPPPSPSRIYVPSAPQSSSPSPQTKLPSFPSLNDPPYAAKPNPTKRENLAQEISAGKARLRIMEAQLNDMGMKLDAYEKRMKSYESMNQIEEYNNLAPIYNSLLGQLKQLYTKYEQLLNEVNAKIDRYNASN